MCPYKLPSEMTSNRLPMSPLGLINTLIFVVIACTLMYFNITVDIYADLSSSGILNFISRAVLMGGLVGTILFTIASVLMRNYNWSMVRLLHKIDTRLTSIGVQFNYKRQFLMILCFTFFWLIFVACVIFYHCIYTTFGGMTYFNMGIHVVSHYMAITTYAVMMSQYFYMLVAIYSRFAALNICFGRHYLDRKAQSSKTGIDNGRVVKELRCAHDELHDLLDKVNAFLSIAAMTGITLSIFLWVLSCSAIYKRNIGDRHSLLMSPIGYVFWSSYFAFFVLTIIIIASNVKSEGRRTAVLIHKGMNLHPNHPDWDELKIFSLQLQCREPVASCGLFSYDYTLLYSVLGSISIYTTIFIQFDSFNYKTYK
ncbi:Gustatory receptor [Sergentomyia squamirostris]